MKKFTILTLVLTLVLSISVTLALPKAPGKPDHAGPPSKVDDGVEADLQQAVIMGDTILPMEEMFGDRAKGVSDMVNQILIEQGLTLEDIWYRTDGRQFVNLSNGKRVPPGRVMARVRHMINNMRKFEWEPEEEETESAVEVTLTVETSDLDFVRVTVHSSELTEATSFAVNDVTGDFETSVTQFVTDDEYTLSILDEEGTVLAESWMDTNTAYDNEVVTLYSVVVDEDESQEDTDEEEIVNMEWNLVEDTSGYEDLVDAFADKQGSYIVESDDDSSVVLISAPDLDVEIGEITLEGEELKIYVTTESATGTTLLVEVEAGVDEARVIEGEDKWTELELDEEDEDEDEEVAVEYELLVASDYSEVYDSLEQEAGYYVIEANDEAVSVLIAGEENEVPVIDAVVLDDNELEVKVEFVEAEEESNYIVVRFAAEVDEVEVEEADGDDLDELEVAEQDDDDDEDSDD